MTDPDRPDDRPFLGIRPHVWPTLVLLVALVAWVWGGALGWW